MMTSPTTVGADGGRSTDAPVAYAVFLSLDDQKYTAVASEAGQSSLDVSFPQHSARYVRVNQYGVTGSWWSNNEIAIQK